MKKPRTPEEETSTSLWDAWHKLSEVVQALERAAEAAALLDLYEVKTGRKNKVPGALEDAKLKVQAAVEAVSACQSAYRDLMHGPARARPLLPVARHLPPPEGK